jgi:ATP-dependent protease ClpP protease subunit
MLMSANEEDSVIFLINSPGGQLNGLLALVEGVKMTDATTMAVLIGECASAASMFALHCDTVFVSDNATMLCHNISYGTGGKGSDILSHVQHVSKTSEKLLRKTYEHFLTEKEIDEMINGREIYLDADEIKERLDKKSKILENLEKKEEQAQKRASRSKKTTTTEQPEED